MTDKVLSIFRESVVPRLSHELHKGSCGRIGIIGGSEIYTGAPYYSAAAALKCGADLVYIFCHPSCAPALKAYSPEMIVQPCLFSSKDHKSRIAIEGVLKSDVFPWLSRLHAIVVGPGLTNDADMLFSAKLMIEEAVRHKIPIVMDADSLYILHEHPKLLRATDLAVITPNHNEFLKLCQSLKTKVRDDSNGMQQELAQILGSNVAILRKGPADHISLNERQLSCEAEGSPRRCGGQGDILAGVLGVFLAWLKSLNSLRDNKLAEASIYSASSFVRTLSKETFASKARSMTSPDMIDKIGAVFQNYIEPDAQPSSKAKN